MDEYPYVAVKYPYDAKRRFAFMRWNDIPDGEDPSRVYIRRLRILMTPWFAFYLHFIYLPDRDRDPHDHPAQFWSLILRGGYDEEYYPVPEVSLRGPIYALRHTWRRFTIHRMPLTGAHRIRTLRPHTITLCLFGRRRAEWGFWVYDQGDTFPHWVPFQSYPASRNISTWVKRPSPLATPPSLGVSLPTSTNQSSKPAKRSG